MISPFWIHLCVKTNKSREILHLLQQGSHFEFQHHVIGSRASCGSMISRLADDKLCFELLQLIFSL